MTCAFAQLYRSLVKNGVRNLFSRKSKYDLGICHNIINDLGNVSPELSVPDHIIKPDYFHEYKRPQSTIGTPEIKSDNDINQMRATCQIAAKILKNCADIIKPGITTDEIDKFVHQLIISENAYPSPLRYGGFPKSICTSVNNVACHGIPNDIQLMNGDIINVDITIYRNGFHGDCSYTFEVGDDVDERGKFLIQSTKQCLDEVIQKCGPNQPINLIGKFCEKFAKNRGLNVVPAFVGHGIGKYFHCPPEILHFDNDFGGLMQPGMTFTIEPILSLGDIEIEIQEDDWTAMSLDQSRSAQFEHTILITDTGVDVLTQLN